MEFKKKSVAIIGAGPAGCMCAYFASKHADVTLFDFSKPLRTLLYTGGGRCNLAYAEYDFKELAKFYPRGEKFLYSAFSKFSTIDTINFFKEIGVETYTQDDLRIFPTSNSAKDVREKFLNAIKNGTFKKEKVIKIDSLSNGHAEPVDKGNSREFETCDRVCFSSTSNPLANTGKIPKQVRDDNGLDSNGQFLLVTNKNTYYFDTVVIATGGHCSFSLAENLGHKIIEPKPALTGLITAENFKSLQGVNLKDVEARIFYQDKKFAPQKGDLLFTHEGISGPLAYKISSICAREEYSRDKPIILQLNLLPLIPNFSPLTFQSMLNSNPKKDIKNLIGELIPKSLAEYILKKIKINLDKKCCDIDGKIRDLIVKSLVEFEINVNSPAKEGEIVTSGGVCLNEIDSKTMQSKLIEGLYFCGEIMDVDGFCGGFNLQNCWTTGFIAGENSIE